MPSGGPGRPRHPRVTDGESGAHRGWTTLPRVQGGGPPSSEHFVPQWVRRRPSDPEPPGQEVALGPPVSRGPVWSADGRVTAERPSLLPAGQEGSRDPCPRGVLTCRTAVFHEPPWACPQRGSRKALGTGKSSEGPSVLHARDPPPPRPPPRDTRVVADPSSSRRKV